MRLLSRVLRPPVLLFVGGGAVGVCLAVALGDTVGSLWDRVTSKAERSWAAWVADTRPPADEWVGHGFRLEPHATGLDFPARLVRASGSSMRDDGDPMYFVAELPGAIRLVTKAGQVHTVATGLLNFDWKPIMEIGLMGLTVEPDSEALFAGMGYWDEVGGVYRNRIERLTLEGSPPKVVQRRVIFDAKNEATIASYCIQFVELGPDGWLYVGVGKGANERDAQDLNRFAGKILRMDLQGRAVPDNPFYDATAPGAPKSYVYAFGFRNPFDIVWDATSSEAVVSDVGPGVDRLLRLRKGLNYCFGSGDGDTVMRSNALYSWGGSSFAPTGVALAPASQFGEGAGTFLYTGLFGPVTRPGPNDGKAILRFPFDSRGALAGAPEVVVKYNGPFFSSVADVIAFPDALYFAEFYGPGDGPPRGKGIVYRVVRSEESDVPDISDDLVGAARGRVLFNTKGCIACHDLGDRSVKEGRALGGVGPRLEKKLGGREYEKKLDAYLTRSGATFVKNRPKYELLKRLNGPSRVRRWFRLHLADPRFDHPEGKMMAYDMLDARDVDALADLLLGERYR